MFPTPPRPFTVDTLTPSEPDEDGERRETLVADARPLASLLAAVERALREEGVSIGTIERVVNRLVWGDPEGYVAVRRIEEERAEADVTMDREAFELGKIEAQRIMDAYEVPDELREQWARIKDGQPEGEDRRTPEERESESGSR